MYRLPQIILILILFTGLIKSQNPHGESFKIDCAKCHTSDSWTVDFKNIGFNHKTTRFSLNGRHDQIDCKECHTSLILSDVKNECIECHEDMHNNTVSSQCNNCHNEDDWIIDDYDKLHDESGFPLTGSHRPLDCAECHTNSVELIFEPLSNECISCHQNNYNEAKTPNHIEENFSTDCFLCHDLNADSWVIAHDFFPLDKGHAISDCFTCHTDSDYRNTSPECFSCHSEDYNNTTNPDHQVGSFSKDCSVCHTLDLGWTPAEYENHDDNDFPIFSGKHKGEWSQCTDCHIDPNNYAVFTCIDCHKHRKSKMDDKHDDESGYVYESNACYKCHPDGSE